MQLNKQITKLFVSVIATVVYNTYFWTDHPQEGDGKSSTQSTQQHVAHMSVVLKLIAHGDQSHTESIVSVLPVSWPSQVWGCSNRVLLYSWQYHSISFPLSLHVFLPMLPQVFLWIGSMLSHSESIVLPLGLLSHQSRSRRSRRQCRRRFLLSLIPSFSSCQPGSPHFKLLAWRSFRRFK